MRPRLRAHVRFTEHADGTYAHAPHGGQLLRGAHLHPWLTRLAPFLTGEHTLAELVGELPCEQRETVERLVHTLARGGYVRDAVPERAHGLTADERRVYAEQLSHLRYLADSPEHRFQRVREAHLTVCASAAPPHAVAAAVAVLGEVVRLGVRAGWRTVDVAVPDAPSARAVRRVADAALRDPSQEVRISVPGDAVPDAGDLVVWVDAAGGEPPVPAALLCPVRVGEGEAWVGPVGDGLPDVGEGPASRVTGAAATVVAGHAVLACERHLAGLESPAPAVRVDLSALTTTEHPVAPPAPPPCASREAVTAWWDGRGTADGPELWERAGALADPRTGPVREVSSGGWCQFPLWTYGAVLRDGRVVGAHGSTREAAHRATLLRALAMALDEASGDGTSGGGAPDPGAPVHGGPVWGWDLVVSAPCRVTEAPGRDGAPRLCALGAGPDVESAVADGVRAVAEEALARRLGTWRVPCPEVSGGQRALLAATGSEVRVFDVSGVLCGASAHAVTLDGATVALRCGGVDEALELALAAWQALRDGGAPYAPYVAGELPVRLRGVRVTGRVAPEDLPEPEREGREEPEGPPPGLVEALAGAGARPVVVPLRGEGPCVVRVVLTEECE